MGEMLYIKKEQKVESQGIMEKLCLCSLYETLTSSKAALAAQSRNTLKSAIPL